MSFYILRPRRGSRTFHLASMDHAETTLCGLSCSGWVLWDSVEPNCQRCLKKQ